MDLEYAKKLAAAHTGQQKKVPGNDGGETFREYCGLSAHRLARYKDCCFDNGGVSAQRLFIAIGKHQKKKGGAE